MKKPKKLEKNKQLIRHESGIPLDSFLNFLHLFAAMAKKYFT